MGRAVRADHEWGRECANAVRADHEWGRECTNAVRADHEWGRECTNGGDPQMAQMTQIVQAGGALNALVDRGVQRRLGVDRRQAYAVGRFPTGRLRLPGLTRRRR
jgi:hypothetical protein